MKDTVISQKIADLTHIAAEAWNHKYNSEYLKILRALEELQ